MTKMKEKEPKVTLFGEDISGGERRDYHSAGVVWGLFLIFAGILFLLNSLGIIPWEIWGEIWRFWPLLLILAGLKIILGNNPVGDILIAIIALLLFSSVLLFILTTYAPELVDWIPMEWKEQVEFWEVIER